jgi:asparagine synthase (glutamine-hydrolysing)
MCGIFGAVSISTPFERMELDRFKSLTDVVSYRGPDSFGYQSYNWNDSHNTDSFQIFFGHRRLSILDLSDDGRQPMCFDNISIIFNGEIFNYVELREELQKEGVIFKTKSDTEVLIRLYARYGEKSFSKLNGMWAFILFDKNLNKSC